MSEHKSLVGVEVKDADQGIVTAVFSTLDVVDSDGDVTVRGAFDDGAPVRVSAYGHKTWEGLLPVGRGVIRASDTEATAEMRFFLGTDHGRNTFETVKEMGDLQEWSYGFDVLDSEPGERDGKDVRVLKRLKVHEVSPVLLGAGVNTRTLAVKDTFSDQAERVLGDVQALVERAQAFGSQSAKEGRVLSTANRERLSSLLSALGEASQELHTLLTESDPEKHLDDLLREAARFERLRAQV